MKSIILPIHSKWLEKILNGEKTIEIRKTKPSCEFPVKVYIYCTKGNYTPFVHGKNMDSTPLQRNKSAADTLIRYEWDGEGETITPYSKGQYQMGDKATTHAWCYGSRLNGKVVAEFTLTKCSRIPYADYNYRGYGSDYDPDFQIELEDLKKTCLTYRELTDYGENIPDENKTPELYAWHITDLKIYDNPRELCEFRTTLSCHNIKNLDVTENVFGKCVIKYEENFFCRRCKSFDGDFNICNRKATSLTKAPQSWCYVEVTND